MVTPLSYENYAEFLRDRLESDESPRGWITKLAQAAGCQRSYLSRVLSEQVQLTKDQAFSIANFLQLTAGESEYFMTMVEFSRSAYPAYREDLKKRMRVLKKQEEDLGKKVRRDTLVDEKHALQYYSLWFYAALHIGVSISELQIEKNLSTRLHLPESVVRQALEALAQMRLVKRQDGTWKFGESELHIGKNSPLVSLHHRNWRERAIFDAQNPDQESIHFTSVQSMSQKSFEAIKQKLLQMIDEANAEAGPSPPEDLFCMTCDFFRV